MQIKIYMFLKSVHRAISRVQTSLSSTQLQLEQKIAQAESIAKGRNRAKVFATTDDMLEWIKNDDNKGQCNVGDNLYIVDVGVPDWWISEVLEEKDQETGQWYKIAQLETQKVDLTPYLQKTGDTKDNTVTFTSEDSSNATTWKSVAVLASGESHSSFLNKMSKMFNNLRYVYNSLTTHKTSTDHDSRYVLKTIPGSYINGAVNTPTSVPSSSGTGTQIGSLYIPESGAYDVRATVFMSAPANPSGYVHLQLFSPDGVVIGQNKQLIVGGTTNIIQLSDYVNRKINANVTLTLKIFQTSGVSLTVSTVYFAASRLA